MRSAPALLCLLPLALLSCGPTSTLCADTCVGCCDSSGACHFGTEQAACGINGDQCLVCSSSQHCSSGLCLLTTGSTLDAGRTPDSGAPADGGAPDAGAADGGEGGTRDGGTHDGGTRDGGTPPDAGQPGSDAGLPMPDEGQTWSIATARRAPFPTYVKLEGVVVSAVAFTARSRSTGPSCADTSTKGVAASFWVVDPHNPRDGLFVEKFRCAVPSDYEPAVGDVLDLSGYIGRTEPERDQLAHRVVLKDQYDFLSPKPASCAPNETPACTPLKIVVRGTMTPPTPTSAFSLGGSVQANPEYLGSRVTVSDAVFLWSPRPLALKRLSAVPGDDYYFGFALPNGCLVHDVQTRTLADGGRSACDFRSAALDGGLLLFTSITGTWDTYSHAPCLDGGIGTACARSDGLVPGSPDAGFTHVLYPTSCSDFVP